MLVILEKFECIEHHSRKLNIHVRNEWKYNLSIKASLGCGAYPRMFKLQLLGAVSFRLRTSLMITWKCCFQVFKWLSTKCSIFSFIVLFSWLLFTPIVIKPSVMILITSWECQMTSPWYGIISWAYVKFHMSSNIVEFDVGIGSTNHWYYDALEIFNFLLNLPFTLK